MKTAPNIKHFHILPVIVAPEDDTFRPEVRRASDARLEEILVEQLGYEESRISRMGYGLKVDLLLDHFDRE